MPSSALRMPLLNHSCSPSFSSHPSEPFCPSFPQVLDRWLTCYLSLSCFHAYEAYHYMLLKHWSNAFSDTATSNYTGSGPWRASLHHGHYAPCKHHAWFTIKAQGCVQVCVKLCVCGMEVWKFVISKMHCNKNTDSASVQWQPKRNLMKNPNVDYWFSSVSSTKTMQLCSLALTCIQPLV